MRDFLRVLVLAALIPGLSALPAAALAPVGERLQSALDAPLTGDPTRINLTSLSTTLLHAGASENASKTNDKVQIFVVINKDTTDDVCFGTVSAVGITCGDAQCDVAGNWTSAGYAAKMNCTAGSASRGSVIPPGQSRRFVYDGTRCPCVVGSAAISDVQVERVVR